MGDVKLEAYKRNTGGNPPSGNPPASDVPAGYSYPDSILANPGEGKAPGGGVGSYSYPDSILAEVSWIGDRDDAGKKYITVENGSAVNKGTDPAADTKVSDLGAFSRGISALQTAGTNIYTQYNTWIWRVIGIVLVILYFVYFGYAMYYEFGSSASVQLLWMTIAVVCLYVIFKFNLWTRLNDLCCKENSVSDRTTDIVSWVVGLVIFLAVIVFIIVDAIVLTEEPYNLVSLSGLALYVIVVFITSSNPSRVKWRIVLWGLNLQLLLALLILRWDVGFSIINWISKRFVDFVNYTDAGSRFVFGDVFMEHRFAFKAMPTVVFMSSFIAILYHLGVMMQLIKIIGWVLQKLMGTTAGESMCAAGNIFLGNTEAPLMILPMIKDMTRSELHCVMVGGFATIAGSAFGIYVLFGAPPNFLIAASVMSAPAALALAKLSYPETEESKTTVNDLDLIKKSPYRNIIDAASQGAIQSIRLVANITVHIIAFLAILEFVNESLRWFGHRAGVYDPDLTFGLICSYILFPLPLCMGVELEFCRKVAEILGIKAFVNTTVAYRMLGALVKNRELFEAHVANNQTYEYAGSDIILYYPDGSNSTLTNGIISARSGAITTFSLCGFASIDAIGIVLGALVAMVPDRKSDLSSLVVRAMLVGNVASFMTACCAGLLFQEE